MKKNVLIVVLLITAIGYFANNVYSNTVNKYVVDNDQRNFKIYLEYKNESAETDEVSYKLSSLDEVFKTNYVFNSELSVCENGGKVTFDNETKTFTYNVSLSDKCNVYFNLVDTEENVNNEESEVPSQEENANEEVAE